MKTILLGLAFMLPLFTFVGCSSSSSDDYESNMKGRLFSADKFSVENQYEHGDVYYTDTYTLMDFACEPVFDTYYYNYYVERKYSNKDNPESSFFRAQAGSFRFYKEGSNKMFMLTSLDKDISISLIYKYINGVWVSQNHQSMHVMYPKVLIETTKQ